MESITTCEFVQPSTVTISLDTLRACRTRNAILAYTTLTALATNGFVAFELPALLQVSALSRTSMYAALAELHEVGLIERTRLGQTKGFRVLEQGRVVPMAGTRLTYKDRVRPGYRDDRIPAIGTRAKSARKPATKKSAPSIIARPRARVDHKAVVNTTTTASRVDREIDMSFSPTVRRVATQLAGRPSAFEVLGQATQTYLTLGSLALAPGTPMKITNLHTASEAPRGATPKAPLTQRAKRFNAMTYAKHLGMVARIAVTPANYTGKDGKLWKQLYDAYGDEELRILIGVAVKDRAKLAFGTWKDAKPSVSMIVYYAKTFYESRADRALKNESNLTIESLPQWLVTDGAVNEDALDNYAAMLGVSSDDLRRRIENELLSSTRSGGT